MTLAPTPPLQGEVLPRKWAPLDWTSINFCWCYVKNLPVEVLSLYIYDFSHKSTTDPMKISQQWHLSWPTTNFKHLLIKDNITHTNFYLEKSINLLTNNTSSLWLLHKCELRKHGCNREIHIDVDGKCFYLNLKCFVLFFFY